MISALDTKILEVIENEEEIEVEVLQAEEVASSISTVKAKITSHLSSIAPSSKITSRTPITLSTERRMEHNKVTRLPVGLATIYRKLAILAVLLGLF